MKIQSISIVVLSLVILTFLAPASLWADDEFMWVDEIKPGMKGVGKTVFSGTEVEDFQVEIIGVLKNAWPKGDLILARLEAEPLKRTKGIIKGMSGSPVYIEGKMIGAVAYGWPFSREAIAGITPIKDMLAVWDIEPGDDGNGGSPYFCDQPVTVENNGESLVLKPLPSPLVISGFDQVLVKEIEPVFNRFGFLVTQGGSGMAEDMIPGIEEVPLIPGSAVAIPLIRGDCNATAIGTLTYLRDGKILAFGHPMFYGGQLDLPLSGAYIHTIMPSLENSFKLGSATLPVGRINQDRRPAVAGEIGKFARMIPVEAIVFRSDEKKESYNFEIVNNKMLISELFFLSTANVILTTAREVGEASLNSVLTIYLKGEPPVTVENTYSSSQVVQDSVAELTGLLAVLMDNAFQDVEVEKISLEVKVEEVRKTARIHGLRLSKNKVRPGESIKLMVILKPFEEDYIIKTLPLTVPEDVSEGRLQVTVSDVLTADKEEKQRAPSKFQPKDLAQLIKLMEDKNRNTELVIRVNLPKQGAVISGEEFPSLPGSVLEVMSSSPEAGWGGITSSTNILENKIPTDWMIAPGSYTLPLVVEGKLLSSD